MLKAVVFVRSDDFDPHAARCTIYCEEQGYNLAGVILDDWPAVLQTIADGEADIVVVSEEAHLDPERSPRIEVVAHAASSHREGRTRLIRRVWGG